MNDPPTGQAVDAADAADALTGCPNQADVRWIVGHLTPGAAPAGVDELQRRLAVDADRAAELSDRMHRCANGLPAIRKVAGYRCSKRGEVVVDYVWRGVAPHS